MTNIEYANAYAEVLEVLKFISKEDYNKIPKEKIELFETNSNKEFNFNYNPELTLDEQNISKRGKAIIAILFRDYWATDEQREKIKRVQAQNRKIEEEKKKEKYNPDDIFKSSKVSTANIDENSSRIDNNTVTNLNSNVENIQKSSNEQTTSMVQYKESILDKIINKIKSLFKK